MELGDVFDKLGSTLLYAVIALIGGIVLVGALVFFLKKEKFADFQKYAAGISIGFAIAAVIAMSYLKGLDTEFMGDGKALIFWPIMAEIIVVIVGALAILICGVFSKKAAKIAGLVTAAGALGAFIAIMVQMAKYYGDVAADYPHANLVGMIVSAVVFMLLTVGIFFLGKKADLSDTRALVYGAVAIALSFALSYAKFFEMPQGGSVTFASLLPLMIYCCMFGTRRGVIVCLIYGVLQAVQDPWIIHPMQFLLDYPLAFGMIGISGIFIERKVFKFKGGAVVGFLLGGIIAVCLRYTCHVLSGVFAFADWADLDTYGTAAAYSLAYNSFAFIDMLISLAAGVMLFGSKAFVDQMDRSSDKAAIATDDGEHILLNDGDDDFEPQVFTSESEQDETSPEESPSDEN